MRKKQGTNLLLIKREENMLPGQGLNAGEQALDPLFQQRCDGVEKIGKLLVPPRVKQFKGLRRSKRSKGLRQCEQPRRRLSSTGLDSLDRLAKQSAQIFLGCAFHRQ